MILPDVNVLIYAFRADLPQHWLCREWLVNAITNSAPFGVSRLALAGVIRITTNPRAFREPSSLEEAVAFSDNILGQPNCHTVEPGERHWEIFKRLCIETDTRGRRVTDAWFAALAIEWGCEWITLDRDFSRFPQLQWRVPELP
jgi:uncharacterized protein